MNMLSPTILVVGSQSLVGAALIREYRDAGTVAIGTTRILRTLDNSLLYEESARIGGDAINVDHMLIQPRRIADLNLFLEPVPQYTTLNVDRLSSELEMVPPNVRQTIKTAFKSGLRS